jgi:hypothetical protein
VGAYIRPLVLIAVSWSVALYWPVLGTLSVGLAIVVTQSIEVKQIHDRRRRQAAEQELGQAESLPSQGEVASVTVEATDVPTREEAVETIEVTPLPITYADEAVGQPVVSKKPSGLQQALIGAVAVVIALVVVGAVAGVLALME